MSIKHRICLYSISTMSTTDMDTRPDFEELQAQNLSCPICKDILYLAVTLFPCIHTVFKTCHITANKHGFRDCTQCRSNVIRAGDNHTIRAVVDTYISCHPDKRKSPIDIAQREKFLSDYNEKEKERKKTLQSRTSSAATEVTHDRVSPPLTESAENMAVTMAARNARLVQAFNRYFANFNAIMSQESAAIPQTDSQHNAGGSAQTTRTSAGSGDLGASDRPTKRMR